MTELVKWLVVIPDLFEDYYIGPFDTREQAVARASTHNVNRGAYSVGHAKVRHMELPK